MNSTPTPPEAQQCTDVLHLLRKLQEFAEAVPSGDRPRIISIVGGSASGKTTIARMLAERLGADKAVLISQDLFQLGSDFSGRKVSRYKWDDPENFDVEAGLHALQSLKRGQPATVPNFDVVANRRQGAVTIPPRPIIIWEGVYAALTEDLRTTADLVSYINAPYALRILRRITRFLARPIVDDVSVPARHMLSFVLLADQDFVSTQKSRADYILQLVPSDLDKEIERFVAVTAQHSQVMIQAPMDEGALRRGEYAGLQYVLYPEMFAILRHTTVLYTTPLDREIAQTAADHWPYIFA